MTEELKALKRQIRKEKIVLRRSVEPQVRKIRSEEICRNIMSMESFLSSETVFIYKAAEGEADLELLEREALKMGKLLAYPLCLENFMMEALVPESCDAFVRGTYGIMEPDKGRSRVLKADEIDMVVAPCTAFDEKCRRIGMGAGYYDRYLEKCTGAYLAAAAFELQKTEKVPAEKFDRDLDAVITEKKIYYKNN